MTAKQAGLTPIFAWFSVPVAGTFKSLLLCLSP